MRPDPAGRPPRPGAPALAAQTGLRVSELTGLNCGDVTLGTGASVRCLGKGRKHRAVPLTTPTQAVLRVWMTERAGLPGEPLFPTRTGRRLSADAVQRQSASTPPPPPSAARPSGRTSYTPTSCGIMWMAGLCGWQQHLRW